MPNLKLKFYKESNADILPSETHDFLASGFSLEKSLELFNVHTVRQGFFSVLSCLKGTDSEFKIRDEQAS